jgi:hypothetical protein
MHMLLKGGSYFSSRRMKLSFVHRCVYIYLYVLLPKHAHKMYTSHHANF